MVDDALALNEVRGLVALIGAAEASWNPTMPAATYETTRAQISRSLPLVRDIAKHYGDEDLAGRIESAVYAGRSFYQAVGPVNELLGLIESSASRAAIFGVQGPKLALSNMHPWVHGPTAQLWDDGHHREAVAAAASAIFDVYLPDKVQMPKGSHPDAMVGKAFGSTTAPFLENPGFATPGQDRTNAYEGAQHLGLACAKLVRNLGTHNVTAAGNEDELLEELAILSRFARIVDSSTP